MHDSTTLAPPPPVKGRSADAQRWLLPSSFVTRALLGCLTATVLAQAAKHAGLIKTAADEALSDFYAFYLTARMIGLGRLEDAYHFASLLPFQRELAGANSFMPWTYPPTFDLVVAPLGLLPLWLAYLVFLAPVLAAYLLLLRRIAGEAFGAVVLTLYPAIIVTTVCGQNGFLTATLIGLTCLGLMRASPAAGLPLGLMAIKPHLAVCFGFYVLATRRWATALCAAFVVALFCAAATLAFGPSIWIAFIKGVGEASGFLREGKYPMYRMVSVYAVLLTIGLPASVAMAAQWTVAATILTGLWIAIRRGTPLRRMLALCALTSPLLSPYAYDYDLPICGIGLALVMSDILALTTARERLVLLASSWLACGWGLGQFTIAGLLYDPEDTPENLLSISGVVLIALVAFVWHVLQRSSAPMPAERTTTDTAAAAA